MKFTQLLSKQHIGKAQRYLWQHQRQRRIPVTKVEQTLRAMNFSIQDATDVISQNQNTFCHPEIIQNSTAFQHQNQPFNWNSKGGFVHDDQYVLQEGVAQACLLTKTAKVDDELPKKIRNLITDIPESINNLLKRFIYTSAIYDAQQVQLPKLKDPNRPAWVFPRVYGISTTRKMHNLTKKFLQLCESLSGLNTAQERLIVHGGLLSMCIGNEYNIKFSSKMDIVMTSSTPLTPIADVSINDKFDMPVLHPLHYTIGLPKLNVCESEDIYSITAESPIMNVHTIFVNCNPEEVKNLTELPVTEDQIHARSMIKSFTIAATYARQRFGLDVKELPEPVVVQCVQSDGQNFHFSVYQLNTLNIDGEKEIKNFWWSEPSIKLFEVAEYNVGQPCLEGINSDVFKRFLAFYRNK